MESSDIAGSIFNGRVSVLAHARTEEVVVFPRASFLVFSILSSIILSFVGCNSSDVKDAIDVAEGLTRKDIDRSVLGINAFANDTSFGSPGDQFREVRDTLGITRVRVLIAWNSQQHPDPSQPPFWGFYDDILDSLPDNMRALLVVTGLPQWMNDPANWSEGDPKRTFVERWLTPVIRRYGSRSNVEAIQVWNEPNMLVHPENTTMGFVETPENYVDLLARASNVIRERAPGKLVVSAATTSINQNFPSTLDYNRALRDAGASAFADRWGIHFYGKQIERVVQEGGVQDFVNGLDVPVWITESGEQGINNQLAYGEEVWPFLRDKMPSIERIYIYQFTENTPSDVSYGLRTLDSAFPVSDLYIWLRDGEQDE
jgi:Glycosyl hydrolase catalytic core